MRNNPTPASAKAVEYLPARRDSVSPAQARLTIWASEPDIVLQVTAFVKQFSEAGLPRS